MRNIFWLLLVLALGSLSSSLAADCIPKARKPIVVSGTLCGGVFDTIGELLPGTSLYLFDSSYVGDVAIAEARVDSRGRFAFSDLPSGRYRLGSGDGGYIAWGQVEIRRTKDARTCKRPIVVYVGTTYSDCSGGWVSETWDRRHFPEGPPREK
jgi:hypothetical protein